MNRPTLCVGSAMICRAKIDLPRSLMAPKLIRSDQFRLPKVIRSAKSDPGLNLMENILLNELTMPALAMCVHGTIITAGPLCRQRCR